MNKNMKKVRVICDKGRFLIKNARTFNEIIELLTESEVCFSEYELILNDFSKTLNGCDNLIIPKGITSSENDVNNTFNINEFGKIAFNYGMQFGQITALHWILGKEKKDIDEMLG